MAAIGIVMQAACPVAAAQARSDLADLSLEELGNIRITSVSKRSERLADAPASVFVITADDIRRSGATSVPEALRLAPNLHVAQVSASDFAVSARGFDSSSANKLLVLIDGRSVYTPLFSGVFWDVQDVLLQDVERIEVISGPGGTLWGVNAVNGVINIVTRPATQTASTLLSASAGNHGADVALRHGASLAGGGAYRVYAKHDRRRHTFTADGTAKDDAWHKSQVGFRAEWIAAEDHLTLQGDAYTGAIGQPEPGTISISGIDLDLDTICVSGANLLASWTRSLAGGSSLFAQAYYDRTRRNVPPTFGDKLDIFDLQLQYSAPAAARHALVLGAGFRYGRDRVSNSDYVAFLPASVNQRWTSLFVQDEITLHDQVRLTLGTRLERNDYTGSEFLPNLRLAWQPRANQLLWAAASRTVRAPSRLDHDTFVPGAPPFLLRGGATVRSEIAKVFEFGYRGQPTERSSLAVTAFRSHYDHLRTQEVDASRTFVIYANGMQAQTSGVEAWAGYQILPWWRLGAGYSKFNKRLWLKEGSNDDAALLTQGLDPARRWTLRASFDLPWRGEFDAMIRSASALSNPEVPGYVAVDARVAWPLDHRLELSLAAQNLFDGGHGEFTDAATRTELGRAFFVNIAGRF